MQLGTLIAIDPAALTALVNEVASLRRAIERVQMAPRPEWVALSVYAATVGRSQKTIRAWVRDGKIESRRDGTVLMIKS